VENLGFQAIPHGLQCPFFNHHAIENTQKIVSKDLMLKISAGINSNASTLTEQTM
jgi:hypothetical protein